MASATAKRRLIGGSIGTFVEWYDFLIYGISAPVLAVHFFPEGNPTASLLGTFAIFGVAFLARPLGGVVFGLLGDRLGRINILAITVLLIGGATMGIGLVPTYESIGVLAPILLCLFRLLQGFAVGGETSGGMAFVVESAPTDRRGRWVGYVGSAAFVPAAVSSLVVFGLVATVGEDVYSEWAWRLPFILGAAFAGVGFILRRKLDDPEEFEEAKLETVAPGTAAAPSRTLSVRAIVRVVLLVAVMGVGGYMMTSYLYSHLVSEVGMDTFSALTTNAVALLAVAALIPVCGAFSDRVGRKPLMFFGAAWLAAGSYPAFVLASSGTAWGALIGQLILALGIAPMHSGAWVAMVELFPTRVRFRGHAIAYNLGFAVFGGTAPFIATLLVSSSGSPVAPAFYLMVVAVFALGVIWFTPETRHVDLRDSVVEVPVRLGETVREPKAAPLSSPQEREPVGHRKSL